MGAFYEKHSILYKFLTFFYTTGAHFSEVFGNIGNNLHIRSRGRATLPKSLEGKVALVTGANAGIGRETITVLAKLGAQVILACRDLNRGSKAVNEIKAMLPEEMQSNVTALPLNLASFESIHAFAGKVHEKVSKIDILINNAGVMMCPESKTTDGYEMQFGTNHLGHFLLVQLLIDLLKAAPSARIVTLSSMAYANGQIHFNNINLMDKYTPTIAYEQSKLANILFTRELARRLRGTNVTTYTLHPGIVRSDISRHISPFTRRALSLFQISLNAGAQTSLYCALEEGLEQYSGSYFDNCHRKCFMLPNATDDEKALKLWDLSLQLCDIEDRIELNPV